MFSAFIISVLIITISNTSGAENAICSVADPDSSKTCISIKFPWKEDPVYFCTEKANVNYLPQCDEAHPSSSDLSCYDDGRNDTLKIATPWDCCPYISTPNHCVNVKCPPKPFNRTCKDIRRNGQCCPVYFCDDDEPSSCKLRRMKSSCMKPPKEKENCTAYRDPYGCCAKFQCGDDKKPGNCSSYLVEESKQTGSYGGNNLRRVVTLVKSTVFNAHQQLNIDGSEMRCIGDSTCPDDMKCCPASIVAYPTKIQSHWNSGTFSTSQTQSSQIKLIDGVCRKPASANESAQPQENVPKLIPNEVTIQTGPTTVQSDKKPM